MSRRGWVSAETGPGQLRRLMVFDDGWVELPGFGRAMSNTRARLKASVRLLVLFLVSLAAIAGVSRVLAAFDELPYVLWVIPGVLLMAVVVTVVVVVVKWSIQDLGQLDGDVVQARAERHAGRRITRAPGAPLFERAESAEQFAAWMEGETHVAAADITDVEVGRDGADHVISVRLVGGLTRTYRSPDGKIVELLGRPDLRWSGR